MDLPGRLLDYMKYWSILSYSTVFEFNKTRHTLWTYFLNCRSRILNDNQDATTVTLFVEFSNVYTLIRSNPQLYCSPFSWYDRYLTSTRESAESKTTHRNALNTKKNYARFFLAKDGMTLMRQSPIGCIFKRKAKSLIYWKEDRGVFGIECLFDLELCVLKFEHEAER
jgi:hypothetical protein